MVANCDVIEDSHLLDRLGSLDAYDLKISEVGVIVARLERFYARKRHSVKEQHGSLKGQERERHEMARNTWKDYE